MPDYTISVPDDLASRVGLSFVDHVLEHKTREAMVLIEKQADYGPNNIARCPIGPVNGLIVRLFDKVARLSHLTVGNFSPKNEALTDTGLDIANYGTILSMVLTAQWPNLDPHE